MFSGSYCSRTQDLHEFVKQIPRIREHASFPNQIDFQESEISKNIFVKRIWNFVHSSNNLVGPKSRITGFGGFGKRKLKATSSP